MLEQLLLGLARIDVRTAGNVHVGRAPGDVHETFGVHMAEVAGAKPPVAERFGVGFRIVEISGEHGGTGDADLAGFACGAFASVLGEYPYVDRGARIAARPDMALNGIVDV